MNEQVEIQIYMVFGHLITQKAPAAKAMEIVSGFLTKGIIVQYDDGACEAWPTHQIVRVHVSLVEDNPDKGEG